MRRKYQVVAFLSSLKLICSGHFLLPLRRAGNTVVVFKISAIFRSANVYSNANDGTFLYSTPLKLNLILPE